MSEPVVSGWKLSRYQRLKLADAERLAVGGLQDRQRAAAIVREVEREISAARDAAETEIAIAKAVARARSNGEAIEVEAVDVGEWRRNPDGTMARRDGQIVLDVKTVRRVSRIDGLASLYKAGSIDDRAKRVGDVFRVLWDRAKPPMSVSDYGVKSQGFCDSGRMLVAVALAGSAGAVIGEIARRIDDERVHRVLCAVAGQGLTIRSLGDGGEAKAANRQRLLDALDVVEEVLSEPKWKGLASQAR